MRSGIKIAFLLFSLSTVHAQAQQRLTYSAFIKIASEQNLSLKVEDAKSEAARANAKGVAIPPPMVGYMKMTENVSGSSANGIEVSQMIPFPTKLSSDHSAREYEAQAQEQASLGAKNEILGRAKVLYFSLWASQQRQQFLAEKKSAIETHIKLSRASVRSDSFLQIHLIKAESDLDLLENEILASEQMIQENEAMLAQFLNQDPSNFHFTLEEPPMDSTPKLDKPTSKMPYQLEASRLTLESLKARESEAKSSWFPDLYLRYKNLGQTQMMPGYTEYMVGISLPFLFPWEPSAQVQKASAQRLQAEAEFQQGRLKISTEKSTLLSKATSLRKQIETINQKLLPRAEKRMRLVHNLAPRDMETLQDHRETMEAFPDLKLKSLELRSQYEEALAQLKKYDRSSE